MLSCFFEPKRALISSLEYEIESERNKKNSLLLQRANTQFKHPQIKKMIILKDFSFILLWIYVSELWWQLFQAALRRYSDIHTIYWTLLKSQFKTILFSDYQFDHMHYKRLHYSESGPEMEPNPKIWFHPKLSYSVWSAYYYTNKLNLAFTIRPVSMVSNRKRRFRLPKYKQTTFALIYYVVDIVRSKLLLASTFGCLTKFIIY